MQPEDIPSGNFYWDAIHYGTSTGTELILQILEQFKEKSL